MTELNNKSVKMCPITIFTSPAKLTIVIGVLFLLIISANGQALNGTYLQAKADMIRGQYTAAGLKILSIPVNLRTSQMYVTLGESYFLDGKYVEAARFFVVADSLSTTPEAELYVARTFAMMLRPAEAVIWLKKYLSQREKLAESELILDPAFEKIEYSKEWKELWSREWYSATERKAAEAAALLKRNKYIEALGIIDAEITGRTLSAALYAMQSKIYDAMEQYEPAYESAKAAVNMRNNNPAYFADAADIAVRAGKYGAALENINRAIRIDPYRLELYLQRAAILRINQQYDDAHNDINFYFRYLPADAKVLYQLGMAETEAGNPLAGIEYLTKLIDLDKTSPDYFIARASAGIIAENYEMASSDLSQALDLNPTLPEAWHKKGIIYQLQNNLDEACYYWRKALTAGSRESAEYIYRYCIR